MPTIELSAGRVHYEDIGPPSARAVVCVHGYTMGGSLWRPLGARLADDGLRCIAPTWPLGAQPEAMRAGATMTMEGIAALVAEFCEALELEDVVLLGNDTGGAVAQLVAADHPERIGALALTSCDAFEHFPPPVLKPLIAAARLSGLTFSLALAPLRTRLGRKQGFGALAHTDIDDLVKEWLAPALTDKAVRANLRELTASLRVETTLGAAERLPSFERPALIAWSEDDAFFAVEDGRRLAEVLPNSRFELLSGARTFSMLDQPDRLAELVAELATAGLSARS